MKFISKYWPALILLAIVAVFACKYMKKAGLTTGSDEDVILNSDNEVEETLAAEATTHVHPTR